MMIIIVPCLVLSSLAMGISTILLRPALLRSMIVMTMNDRRRRRKHTSSSSFPLPRELAILLDRCCTLSHITQTHAFMVSRGLDQHNTLLSKLIDSSTSLGLIRYAYSLFLYKDEPNLFLWNTTIKALAQTPYATDAISLYNRIQAVGFRPDCYSFPFVLKACTHLFAIKVIASIHAQAIWMGFRGDIHVQTGFIQAYSTCGCLSHARHVFDEMSRRDVISWNAIIAAYVKFGDIDTACQIFQQTPQKDVISWTVLIAGYAQLNRPNEAILLFRRMQFSNVVPDEITMLSVLSACAQLGALELGEWMHGYIDKHKVYRTIPLNNSLIDMYVKSGRIDKAQEVFDGMTHKSVITWTTMIAGLALHGLGFKAIDMFSRMKQAKVKPNDVTFIAILSACCHIGFVDAGRWFFEQMKYVYNMKPKIEHYGCMVDLLGRAGYLLEACRLINEMPFKANAVIWGALLAAARIYGDVQLGELALKHLIEVEPHNGGNYILLSNTYAALGRWEDAAEIRKMMKDRGVKKSPGGSYIEVGNIVHEFVVGDMSHPDAAKIYEMALETDLQIRIAGYVPNIHGSLLDLDAG